MELLVGQQLRVTTTFTNTSGQTFDPATVVFKFKDPGENISIREAPERDSKGVYEIIVSLTSDGTWWGRAEGHDESGGTIAADEFPFEVQPSEF